MAAKKTPIHLSGSWRPPPSGSRIVGPADANERIRVTVYLRRGSARTRVPAVDTLGIRPPGKRRHLTREQFAAAHGARAADLTKIRAFAATHNLTVVEERPAQRSVVLEGTVGDFCKAFGIRMQRYAHANGTFRGHDGPISIPGDLSNVIEGVFGLDDRPQVRPHFRWYQSISKRFAPSAAGRAYTPPQVAELYRFPPNSDGTGQCIGIVELGGGYVSSDLTTYFGQLGIAPPTVVAVGVDGGSNQPTGDPNGPDAEVALDIEVAGAVAPRATIAVYFAPNTDRGFLDAVSTAIHDTTNRPGVISISWGSAEPDWTATAIDALDSVCEDAAAMGVTICAASGDGGSSDGVSDGKPHVDFPASSPHVLGCGGTMLSSSGSQITAEDVWNDLSSGGGATGGGVSTHFPPPAWQKAANVPKSPSGQPGRGVPDVAADAAPSSGYQVFVDGQRGTVGGTSAAAPLWAGLIARLNQLIGAPAGLLNPLIYSKLPGDVLNDITSGNNGAYHAGPDWDPCTGLGSPNGDSLLAALREPSTAATRRKRPATTRKRAARGRKKTRRP